MEHLNTIKNQLKERLPKEGITPIFKALKDLLPEHSPKRNILLQLEAEYKDIKLKSIERILSDEALSIANNQFRKRLIEFIDSLEADDFSKEAKRSRLRPDNKIKQGHVLYRIPHQMQLQKEVKCLVRIALDKIALIEDIDVDEHTQVRSEVRVSDYMKVLLIDPAASPAFAIRSTSEPVQFIDEDAATEWKFYVTPLLPGEHMLELKVVVMEIINGVERVREKSLEESVVIVTEAVEEMDDAPLQSANMDFVTSDAAYTFEKEQSGFRLPKVVRTSALILAALIAFSTTTYAIAPHEVEWVTTRYLQDNKEAYETYIKKYPNSRHRERATYRKAVIENTSEAYQEYLKTFPNGDFEGLAVKALQDLKEKLGVLQFENTPLSEVCRQLEDFYGVKIEIKSETLRKILFVGDFKDLKLEAVLEMIAFTFDASFKKIADDHYIIIETRELSTTERMPQEAPHPKDSNTPTNTRDIITKIENTTVPEQKQPVKEEPAKTEAKTTQEPPKEEPKNEPAPVNGKQPDAGYFEAIRAKMVLVKGGTFQMGEPIVASPVHLVTVPDFYISKYEITFEEYDAFCDATKRQKPEDSGWGHGKRPVINVSWEDATAYCKWLSEKTGNLPAGRQGKYRLPTEAEWEYAARGGSKSKGFKYSGSDDLNKVAVYNTNKTQPVGGKAPNELGLYDMSGNVWEWCSDWYGENYYQERDNTNNPKGPKSGDYRVLRGGSWVSIDSYCRVADRGGDNPGYRSDVSGFRLAQDK